MVSYITPSTTKSDISLGAGCLSECPGGSGGITGQSRCILALNLRRAVKERKRPDLQVGPIR